MKKSIISVRGETKDESPAVTSASRLPSKLVLAAFGAHLPGVKEDPNFITFGLPPFIAHNGQLRIDYVPFVVHKNVVFDGEMFDRIMHRQVDELKILQEDMRILKERERLHLEDIGSVLKKKESVLQHMRELDEKMDMSVWAPGIQDAIRGWLTVQEGLGEALGNFYTFKPRLPYGIQVALGRRHTPLSMEAGQEMALRLLKPYDEWTKADVEDGKAVAELYLTIVNQTLIISENLGTTWHDWDNVGKLYREKLIGAGRELEVTTPETKLKEFATIAFPEVVPDTPEALIELIEADETESLRSLIQAAADGRVALDSNFARKELWDALKAERGTNKKLNKFRTIMGWLTLPLPLLYHIPGHIVGKGLEEGAAKIAEHQLNNHRYDYLYFLSQRKNFTKK